MKPLLVGDQPTRAGDQYWSQPLSGVFARTLCRIADLGGPSSRDALDGWTKTLCEHFICVNAQQRYGAWNSTAAAARLSQVVMPKHEVCVLFGRKVQQAFANMTFPAESPVLDAEFYEWVVDPLSPTGRREVVVLPPPAAVKPLTAQLHHKRMIARVLREAIDKAKAMHETRL